MNQESRPAEPTTLAIELEVSFKERRSPCFKWEDVLGWIDVINYLVRSGRPDIAEHGVRHLHDAFPTVGYASDLGTVFDNLPQAGSQLPFEDDFGQEVQIVARQGAETVVLLFCGAAHMLGMPITLEHRWHGRLNASLIYLRDFQGCRYLRGLPSLGATREATLAELRRIIASLGAGRIVCYGTSGGVFGALHYALDLEAEAVLCMAGPTNLSPEFNRYTLREESTTKLRAEMRHVTLDLRQLYASASQPPRVRIVYGQNFWEDRLHAEHMGTLSCVTLQAVEDFDGHNVTVELIKRGQFEEMLHWLVPPAADWSTWIQRRIASHLRSIRSYLTSRQT